MKKFKKILLIAVWILLVSGLFVTLGFVNKAEDSLPCKSLDITVKQDDENFFVDKNDINQLIHDRGDSVVNQPLRSLNIPELENVLNSQADIAKAEVFVTVNGEVKVNVEQRRPIVRIINRDGESYYIDETGTLMPLSDKYTARVLVVNGNVSEPFSKWYNHKIADIANDPELKDKTMLDEIFKLAQYIRTDDLWRAQIAEVYLNGEREFEFIPRVGDQRIVFGNASDLDDKFSKLLIFYRDGLNATGWWNSYSVINLKYKDQVVCTKKEVVDMKETKLKSSKNKEL